MYRQAHFPKSGFLGTPVGRPGGQKVDFLGSFLSIFHHFSSIFMIFRDFDEKCVFKTPNTALIWSKNVIFMIFHQNSTFYLENGVLVKKSLLDPKTRSNLPGKPSLGVSHMGGILKEPARDA